MNTANIEVAFVNPPAAGKKMGNLKLKDGSFYSVSPAMLGQFRNGGSYEITYDEHDYNGKMYRTVKTVKQTGAAVNGTGGGKYGATDDKTAERIFVCGALNAFIAAGKIEPSRESVTKAVNAIRASWGDTFGSKEVALTGTKKPTVEEDLNDEIPNFT